MKKDTFDIRQWISENKHNEPTRVNEGRGFDNVEELNQALNNVQSGKDAEDLLRTLYNAGQTDVISALVGVYLSSPKLHNVIAQEIKKLAKSSNGPFSRMPK